MSSSPSGYREPTAPRLYWERADSYWERVQPVHLRRRCMLINAEHGIDFVSIVPKCHGEIFASIIEHDTACVSSLAAGGACADRHAVLARSRVHSDCRGMR